MGDLVALGAVAVLGGLLLWAARRPLSGHVEVGEPRFLPEAGDDEATGGGASQVGPTTLPEMVVGA